jgi:peptidoglycan/xylan/chitin deacetylase (PgdA/CDA1 family)
MVLNYHRIGNPLNTLYDPSVFSATAEGFDEQLRFLKKLVHVATLEEAIEMAERPRTPGRPSVLLTFDDGYLDNYQLAFPVLSSNSLQASFFLPTSFIGTNRFPWWDTVAYIVKTSKRQSFSWGDPPVRFDIATEGIFNVLDRIYRIYKQASKGDGSRLITELEEACESARPHKSERCFMNWTEAAEMLRGGMAIGSHTHNHAMLGKLPADEQLCELVTSRQILESRLGTSIQTIAYPNGSPETFNLATYEAAREAGYRLAFSFYGGFNRLDNIERFNVRRLPVGHEAAFSLFQLQVTVGLLSGTRWL